MNIESDRISPRYFVLGIVCFVNASSLLLNFFRNLVEQDSWMIIFTGVLVAIPELLIYGWLINRFQGKNLMEMTTEIFGTAIGKFVSVLYLFFFLTISALNLLDMSVYVQKTMMLSTPPLVLMLLFMFVCSLAVRGGLHSITRYGPFISVLAVAVVMFATLLAINLFVPENLLPVFDFPFINYIQATHIAGFLPFGELVAFLMISGNVKIEPKKFNKLFIIGLLIGSINLLVITVRDTLVLGNTAQLFNLPSFEVFRLINVSDALSRMEVLSAIILIMQLFFKVSFMYYIISLATAQIFNLKSYKNYVYGIGLIIILYTFGLYDSSVVHAKMAKSVTPFLWMFFELVIPLIMMITAAARKKKVTLPALQEDYNI